MVNSPACHWVGSGGRRDGNGWMSVLIACRIIGWGLFLLGVAVAGYEVNSGLTSPEYQIVPLGTLWFKLDAGSLNGLQAGVQRYLWPGLWDDVLFHILRLPAWTVFALPGLLLMLLCRARTHRRNIRV